jgi:hypothetical protein
MPKIRIPVEKMPPPDIYGDHTVQFRIVSEDRNRVSAWSPLYTVKSLGQYRPYRSVVVENLESGGSQESFIITWDTPTIYNYDPSLVSASIAHNHSQNFKQHQTDIFLRWYNGTSAGHFEYHDRVLTDSTTIAKSTADVLPSSSGPTNIEIVGLISTYGLSGLSGSDLDSKINSMKGYLAIFDVNINLSSGALTYVLPLFP